MTDITSIPLNKLTAWEGNVRKTQNKGFIDELAASIKAHGLQQNLVVRKQGRTFAVVAGGQRLKALNLLAKAGAIAGDHPVPCRIADGDIDASELSLAENVVRDNMHPADQFDAFRGLIDKGMPMADVAARFGVTETVVAQRLKLARVSPVILQAYREERLNLEHVMAFAVSDDHDAQERVFADMPSWHGAREIRDALTENDIVATDKRVKFVTLKAYEKAGGATRRDLFTEDDGGVFILDVDLLDRLARAKLEKAAKPVRKEGWKWVQVTVDFAYQQSAEYRRIHAEPVPLTASEQKKLDKLQAEYEQVNDAWNNADDNEEAPPRLDELEKLIAEFDDRDGVWTSDKLAVAGAVVTIDPQGKVKIERGLVRPEDMPKQSGKAKTAKASDTSHAEGDGEQSAGLSASLVENLTAHKSAALAATLLDAPEKGLAAVVYALVLKIFNHGCDTTLKLSAAAQSLGRVEGSTAFDRLETARETWGQRIPGTPGDIWQWCLEQDQAVLIDLLTFCAACTLNGVQMKSDRPDAPRLVHAGQLAATLRLDMKPWFTPTAENYFSRISKPQVLDALREAKGKPPAHAWEKLKKPDLAALAEREMSGTGWLPPILR